MTTLRPAAMESDRCAKRQRAVIRVWEWHGYNGYMLRILPQSGLSQFALLGIALSIPVWAAQNLDHLSTAENFYKQGKLHQALDEFDRVLKKDPNNAAALRGRGLIFMRWKNFELALPNFERAAEAMGPYRETKFPGIGGYLEWRKAQDIYYQGNELLERNEYEQAATKYREALQIYPSYPQCLHNLAIVLGKAKKFAEAEIACVEAIAIRHDDWKFWRTLSFEFYSQGKYRSALAALQEALRLNPPVPEAAEMIENLEIYKDYIRNRGLSRPS